MQIKELRKNIKNKHRALKREIIDTEEFFEKQLKPIADPLKKLVADVEQKAVENVPEVRDTNSLKRKLEINTGDEEVLAKRHLLNPPQGLKRKPKLNLPTEPDYESDYGDNGGDYSDLPAAKRFTWDDHNMDTEEQKDYNEEMITEPILDQMRTPIQPSTSTVYETSETAENIIKTPEGRSLAKAYIDKLFKGKIAKEYFLKLITGSKTVDHNYGVRVDGDSWMLGSEHVTIDGDDLIIGGKIYKGTRGLYDLIFMNNPDPYVFTQEDLDNYALILKETNSHRINYSQLERVKSNKGRKYKNIIAPIVARESQIVEPMDTVNKSGRGIEVINNKPSVIYFDDPNELVERLKILIASRNAGNTGHANEINAIIEELYEVVH